jgi:DNA-binding response OmpR family regulator
MLITSGICPTHVLERVKWLMPRERARPGTTEVDGAETVPTFNLDIANQCVMRDGRRIQLAPKAYTVLNYLIEHPAES